MCKLASIRRFLCELAIRQPRATTTSMAGDSGTGSGREYVGGKRAGSAGGLWPWVVSLAVHGCLLTGVGFVGQPVGRQAASGGARKGEIVLVARWGERDEYASPNLASFTAVVNRAPDLLPVMQRP